MIDPISILCYCAGISWFGIVLYHHVREDVELWLKGLPKTHGWPAIRERGLHLHPSVVCFSLFHPFPWIESAFWEGIATVPVVIGLLMALWWTLFDGFYNVARTRTGHARRFGWWDLGDPRDPTEGNQSGNDQFLYGKPLWLQITIKLGFIALMLACYLLPYFTNL